MQLPVRMRQRIESMRISRYRRRRASSRRKNATGAHRTTKRRIKVTVPEFSLSGYLVDESDTAFTSSRRFADCYADYVANLPAGRAVVGAPPELPPMRFHMLWHERAHQDPGNRRLREQIEAVASRLGVPV